MKKNGGIKCGRGEGEMVIGMESEGDKELWRMGGEIRRVEGGEWLTLVGNSWGGEESSSNW